MNPYTGQPQGELMRYPHGSNGDVHRGPDKLLRRNTIRVMFLGALADAGLSLEDLRRFRKHRKGATLAPLAMVAHCKQAFKNIALAAAAGDLEAFGPFLRMMSDAHVMCSLPRTRWVKTGPPGRRSSCTRLRLSRRRLRLIRQAAHPHRGPCSTPTARNTYARA